MNIVVVEDETNIANRLIRLVAEVVKINPDDINHFGQLDGANAFIHENPPDLLFLDLNLSGKDGFDILRELSVKKFETIIVSANTDRALEAFEYGVLDFVSKPFSKERIAKAIIRFKDSSRRHDPRIRNIPVKKYGSIQLIPLADVLYIKGANNYSEIHTRDGKRSLSEKSLDSFMKTLPDHFERIHRSYILDMNDAQKLIKSPGSKYEILLKNDSILPLGRKYYKLILSQYFSG